MPIRLLRTDDDQTLVFEEFEDHYIFGQIENQQSEQEAHYKYAVLSHRWRKEEVEYQDRLNIAQARRKQGWKKLATYKQVARDNGYQYVWMDTCCIDKTNSTELTEALNSMYRWYRFAGVCYAYLDDVHDVWTSIDLNPAANNQDARFEEDSGNSEQSLEHNTDDSNARHKKIADIGVDARFIGNQDDLELSDDACDDDIDSTQLRPLLRNSKKWDHFGESEWIARGWTLQELIAPTHLVFLNSGWRYIGSLQHMAAHVAAASGIDESLLDGTRSLHSFSVAQKMNWAAERKTTRVEDKAYSLLGLFDVSIPIIYGEGARAFKRLQEELVNATSDSTILAWSTDNPSPVARSSASLYAESPEAFRGCHKVVAVSTATQEERMQRRGRRLELTTHIFVPLTSASESRFLQAVIGCMEDDRTKLVTLCLDPVTNSHDLYSVHRAADRVKTEDIFCAAVMEKPVTLTVFHSLADIPDHDAESTNQRVIFRFLPTQQSPSMTDYTSGNRQPEFHIVKALPAKNWDATQQSFLIPQHNGEQEPRLLRCEVKLQCGQGPIVTLSIKVEGSQIRLSFATWLDLVRIAGAQRYYMERDGICWTTSIPYQGNLLLAGEQKQRLLSYETTVVRLRTISAHSATRHAILLVTFCIGCCLAGPVSYLPLTFPVYMPLIVISVLRRQQAPDSALRADAKIAAFEYILGFVVSFYSILCFMIMTLFYYRKRIKALHAFLQERKS